jgi:hypothetical protein
MSTQTGSARRRTGTEPRLANESETAEYIADLLRELEAMARTGGLVRLAYLLRECVEEADKAA